MNIMNPYVSDRRDFIRIGAGCLAAAPLQLFAEDGGVPAIGSPEKKGTHTVTKSHRDKAFGDTNGKAWRRGRVLIHIDENIITHEDTGKKDLQLKVQVESREQVFTLGQLKMTVLVIGIFNDVDTPFMRMILNETDTFSIKARKTHKFDTSIMKSGEGDPSHINYGILYRGFLVVIQDRHGDIIRTNGTNTFLEDRFVELSKVQSGQNFKR